METVPGTPERRKVPAAESPLVTCSIALEVTVMWGSPAADARRRAEGGGAGNRNPSCRIKSAAGVRVDSDMEAGRPGRTHAAPPIVYSLLLGGRPYFPFFSAAAVSALASRLISTFTSSPRSTPPLSIALFQTMP